MGKTLDTNKIFSQTDKIFIDSCAVLNIPATTRQASGVDKLVLHTCQVDLLFLQN